jgi:hypothetical protein
MTRYLGPTCKLQPDLALKTKKFREFGSTVIPVIRCGRLLIDEWAKGVPRNRGHDLQVSRRDAGKLPKFENKPTGKRGGR